MPRHAAHVRIGVTWGAFAGALSNIAAQAAEHARALPPGATPNLQIDFGRVLLGAVGGAIGGRIGGVLPDVIEPAVHWSHRREAHTVAAGGVALALGVTAQTSGLPELLREVAVGAGAGYISHLHADHGTSKLRWF